MNPPLCLNPKVERATPSAATSKIKPAARRGTRATLIALCLIGLVWRVSAQSLGLPTRPTNALTGSEFVIRMAQLDFRAREQEIYEQITSGNIPGFLRRLCPVTVTNCVNGRTNTATYYVAPDYVAIGSDGDYFLTPMSPATAQRIADALHCTLPSRKMVNDIYAAASTKLTAVPIPPGPAMVTVPIFAQHNALVKTQRFEQLEKHPLGVLVGGDKKDVVITSKLADVTNKVAIYGWHKPDGAPIQPLYLGHTAA